RRVWHFQLVRHDVWDRDPPNAPTLITVNGRPALAQTTKAGVVFILDRLTGQPLYPLKTLRPPASDVPGETTADSQVVPERPEPFARQQLTADMLTNRTPDAHAAVARTFAGLSARGPFDPPSLKGTILFPGMDGGAEYGGTAYDPETGLIYINANEMAWVVRLKQQAPRIAGASGEALYQNVCASCHGAARQGSPPEFPSLVDVDKRLSDDQISRQIAVGGGRMPAFGKSLGEQERAAIVAYLKGDPAQAAHRVVTADVSSAGDPYAFEGYNRFLDPDGYPAVSPPWGTLSALDVNTGKYVWKQPLGYYPELKDHTTGSENYGGAVITKGGVLFIAATVYDNQFRAFDKATGKLLWQTTLPAAGIATPATYAVNGRQYVVIAAGGGKNTKAKPAGTMVAYTLK
ncbi:MAG: c-type cytochrome, partial [Asticcacaulis sp.]|nr:c-type cytochrome [Asticcacaulis sp.]